MTNRDWPNEHRTALAVLMVLVIATVLAYFFLLRPHAVVVEDVRGERNALLKELQDMTKETPYPLDANRLQTMVANAKRQLDGITRKREDGSEYNTGLVARSKQVLEQATSMFDERIQREYTDISTFMNQVSRIVYRDELDELKRRLAGKKIALDEEILGIGEDTVDEETYQLMLKIWTIDRLVGILVEQNGLAIETRQLAGRGGAVRAPFGLGGGGRQAAEITVLPTRFFILHKDDTAPYVMELPIRVRVRGPLATVCKAIVDLQANGNFMTANRMVLEVENPSLATSQQQPDSEGFLGTRDVVVTLEVSSYFRPSGHAPTARSTNEQTFRPRGT